jgi:hypothetical protein
MHRLRDRMRPFFTSVYACNPLPLVHVVYLPWVWFMCVFAQTSLLNMENVTPQQLLAAHTDGIQQIEAEVPYDPVCSGVLFVIDVFVGVWSAILDRVVPAPVPGADGREKHGE